MYGVCFLFCHSAALTAYCDFELFTSDVLQVQLAKISCRKFEFLISQGSVATCLR